MNFQEFLARKRALALVEHMNTLSEADAQELFDTLDEETVEFIEAVLSEDEKTPKEKRDDRRSAARKGARTKQIKKATRKYEEIHDPDDILTPEEQAAQQVELDRKTAGLEKQNFNPRPQSKRLKDMLHKNKKRLEDERVESSTKPADVAQRRMRADYEAQMARHRELDRRFPN